MNYTLKQIGGTVMKKRIISIITSFAMILSLIGVIPEMSDYKIEAITSADLKLSQNGVEFICERESFHATCYADNTQSSIGFGTKCTGSSAQPHASGTHSITYDDALSIMKSQIESNYSLNVKKQTSGIEMTQNQFDALVSLCYNTGGGTSIISNSPLVKYLKGYLSKDSAYSQYCEYIIMTGSIYENGLRKRRKAEANLFFSDYTPISLTTDTYYSSYMPLIAYINSSNKVNTYESDCSTYMGYIEPGDKCTIQEVYTNGWCSVQYPTPSGNRLGYVPVTSFLCNNSKSLQTKTANKTMATYSRADMTTNIGSISSGDICYIVGTSGTATQSIYPTSAGKKLGWSATSDWNYIQLSTDDRFNPYCPIKGYILSTSENKNVYESDYTTKGGSIYIDDFCTINEVYSDGWCYVTYPTSSQPKSKYIQLTEFVQNTSYTHTKRTATKQINVYTKSDMSSSPNWWISANDVYFEVSKSGNVTQVMYPIDAQYGGGYKLGWVYTSDINIPTYTISYNANNGSGAPASQTKTYNVPLTLSSITPTRSGYTFAGWATSASGKASYTAGGTYSGNSAITLYAVWSPNKYTISFDANGGYGNTEPQIKTHGTALTLKSTYPSKEYTITLITNDGSDNTSVLFKNCTFIGWNKSKSATTASYTSGASFNENANTTLYAIWKNPTVGSLQTPSKSGYTFNGWYTASSDGTKISSSTTLSGNTTLYAQWTKNAVVTTVTTKSTSTTTTTKATTTAKTTTTTTTIKTTTSSIPKTTAIIIRDGDINKDGNISVSDVVLAQKMLTRKLNDSSIFVDMNNDNKFNVFDCIILKRKIIDLIDNSNMSAAISYNSFTYGESEMGRELVCHEIYKGSYDKTILLNFAIHGFEDEYDADGQVLVETANYLIEHYRNSEDLNCRLLIVPCANPDGLMQGNTNNGFGRCNVNGIDLNRDFDVNYSPNTEEGRNYTPYAFSAAESRALRDLVNEYNPQIVLDFHGWLNYTIGDSELAEVFYDEMNLSHHTSFTSTNAKGYFANWAHSQGCLGLLVEFKDTEIDYDKLINAINRFINDDYDNGKGEYTVNSDFEEFMPLSGYTLSTDNVTTYQFFDTPFSGLSYIAGSTDLCTIQKVYTNGWVKVEYPVSSGLKSAYCMLSDFINPDEAVTHYTANVSTNTTVYRRSDMTETIGSVWTTDTFTVVAENDNMLQIIYPLDSGGYKMGWIEKNT